MLTAAKITRLSIDQSTYFTQRSDLKKNQAVREETVLVALCNIITRTKNLNDPTIEFTTPRQLSRSITNESRGCNCGICRIQCHFEFIPLPHMPILGSSYSAANKDMMSKIGQMGVKLFD